MPKKEYAPFSLYESGREYLKEQERKNEILAEIAGVSYEPPGDIPSGKYVIEKRMLDAAQKENELLEDIAEIGGSGGGANKLDIDYATDVVSLKKNDTAIADSGVTLPAYGLNYNSSTGGLTLTKNGTGMQGQTVALPAKQALETAQEAVQIANNAVSTASTAAVAAVPTVVTGWLGDHVDPETGYVIDNSLSIADAAADAKAAGNKIASVESALEKTCKVEAKTYTLYVSSDKYYYFNITKFQESTSKKYLSTRYVNDLNSIIAFELRSNDFQYNVFYFDETGAASTSSATGYIGSTGYKTGIQFLPKEAKKFLLTFRRVDGNAISTEDQTTIMSNLYAYYSVDTSLTKANVAADAKATGDFITTVLDYSAQGVQDGLWIRYNTINKIKKGTTIEINTTVTSGTARDVVWYKHNTNEENLIGYEKFGVGFVYTATEDTTVFTGYLRNASSAVITSTLKTHGIANHEERIDAIEDPDITVPSYAKTTVESIYTKLMALQNSKSATIAMLTDVHVAGADLSDKTQKALLRSVRSLNSIANHNPIDFMVFNGDYLYNGATQTKSATISWYKQLAKTIHKLNVPFFIGKGNHDVNDIDPDGDQYLTDEELYQQFLKYSTLPYVGNYGYLEKAYGYFDIPQKKIRCLFINTVDVPFEINDDEIVYPQQSNTGISNEQLNFIADALDISDDGWGVVIFSHHALQTSDIIGTTNSRRLNPDMGGTQLLGVLNAFKNKTTYSDSTSPYNVSADYTHNGSDEIICMISGHIHADRTDVVNGIRMITSISSSYIYTAYDDQGQTVSRTVDTLSETSWDIFTIDRSNEKIYATRYGYGDDREFTY